MCDLISRQAAIKHGEDIIDAINSMVDAVYSHDWIPCTERLPDDDGMVLVKCRSKRGVNIVSRAYYSNGFLYGSRSMSGALLAWMPLPEPYKEEKNEPDKR